MPAPEIRLLTRAEPHETFLEIGRLHAEEIKGGFLASLGIGWLARLYEAIGRSPHAFTLVATVDGSIIGFLCGSADTRRVYRHVLTRDAVALLPGLLGRLASWRTVKRCWETLRYPSRAPVLDLPSAEILNFCVAGRVQRLGVGRLLFRAMEAEFARRGVRSLRIVTGASQLSAIRFYESLGAEPAGNVEVHAQVQSRLFRYSIPDRDPESAAAR
ncbi:MAG: GNAT family N-acetyltransferase [Gemmatimonadales bacterium]|jgi:ribosomal protein S18 acetylase RimI-like enzyme